MSAQESVLVDASLLRQAKGVALIIGVNVQNIIEAALIKTIGDALEKTTARIELSASLGQTPSGNYERN